MTARELKDKLMVAFNELNIQDMEKVTDLNALKGSFINIEYSLPSGQIVKFWDGWVIWQIAAARVIFSSLATVRKYFKTRSSIPVHLLYEAAFGNDSFFSGKISRCQLSYGYCYC